LLASIQNVKWKTTFLKEKENKELRSEDEPSLLLLMVVDYIAKN